MHIRIKERKKKRKTILINVFKVPFIKEKLVPLEYEDV
jgi:hypothetical protein